ncbi:MAG TPA: cell division protein FtsZ [Bryobacteraceae bacterium]|jgi:cell division protein FtsZ|nr:cell division protein FtsZ [Bryobacteraceae bacterium]
MALDALKFVIQEEAAPKTRIRVFGVGGGGCNAVARMQNEGLCGVEFCVINTDVQALSASPVPNQLAIGSKVTNGLGAGSDPLVGRQAALEDTEKIIDLLEGADMVFVTAGLGGGTGTGAAPVVASLAKELGALTVAVVTKPFAFEGPKRRKQADLGLSELASVVDTVITIPNDQLLELVPKGTSFFEAFRVADDVLRQAVQGISDIITTPGLINRDFSDIRSIMLGMGYAMMGTASAKGENAAMVAAERAISCSLMEAGGVRGARGVLINIMGSSKLGLHEVNEACTLIRNAAANEDVQINFGVVLNETMGEEVKITVIATGFERENLPAIERRRSAAEIASAPAPEPEQPSMQMDLPEPEPVAIEAAPESEPAPDAAEIGMAASANGAATPPAAPLFDDLDVPAILRRDRRFVQ